MTRVIVVLGFSTGGTDELHSVCAARLAAAAAISGPTDVVVLSGWGRNGGGRSEAELMRDAWRGSAMEVVVDPDAQTTVENLANALNDILRVGAHEVVVVTSSWHAPRAKAALRWLLLHTGIKVTSVSPTSDSPHGGSRLASLREAPLWAVLPFQLWRAGRKSWSI